MPQPLAFWFTAGSTYTYLSVNRLEEAARAAGIAFTLHPFNLGLLFREAGYWPFPEGAAKTAYMWQDIARQAARLGLSPNLPAPYPAPDVPLANRIAQVMIDDGRGMEWLKASYREWFENGHPPGSAEATDRSLRAIGADPAAVLARASTPQAEAAFAAATDEARQRGIFGSPSFMVGDALFWGDDRLDQAIEAARSG